MLNEYFREYEASRKIGRMIKTNIEFSGVPKDTRGMVVDIYPHNKDNWGVSIQWSLDHKLVDGFSKTEYVQFLEEV
jgi:hypothetical protein